MIIFEEKYLKDQGIIHAIRENISITGFQIFFKNLLTQLKLFTKNGNIAKSCK